MQSSLRENYEKHLCWKKQRLLTLSHGQEKLIGNGNGMQYLRAILFKSKLSLNDLEDHYSAYQKNECSYLVEPQKNQIIGMIEHSRISFSEKVDDGGYYIVYSWGDGPDLLEGLDFRGH